MVRSSVCECVCVARCWMCVLFNQWRLNGWLVMWQIGYLIPPQYFTQYLHELAAVYRDRTSSWQDEVWLCVCFGGVSGWGKPTIQRLLYFYRNNYIPKRFYTFLSRRSPCCCPSWWDGPVEVVSLHPHNPAGLRSGNSDTGLISTE